MSSHTTGDETGLSLKGVKKSGKRGRKPLKMDSKAKLERSRQSARECRARKKLRYQYLEELVASRERSIYALRNELEAVRNHCSELDEGRVPKEVQRLLAQHKANVSARNAAEATGSRAGGGGTAGSTASAAPHTTGGATSAQAAQQSATATGKATNVS